MDCVKYIYIADVLKDSRSNGTAPLFGFAVSDYMAKYKIAPEFLEEYGGRIFAAILHDSDFAISGDHGWTPVTAIAFDLAEYVDMYIFDILHISKENLEAFLKYFSIHLPCYEELKGVYEDRIVFVSKHINERGDDE